MFHSKKNKRIHISEVVTEVKYFRMDPSRKRHARRGLYRRAAPSWERSRRESRRLQRRSSQIIDCGAAIELFFVLHPSPTPELFSDGLCNSVGIAPAETSVNEEGEERREFKAHCRFIQTKFKIALIQSSVRSRFYHQRVACGRERAN